MSQVCRHAISSEKFEILPANLCFLRFYLRHESNVNFFQIVFFDIFLRHACRSAIIHSGCWWLPDCVSWPLPSAQLSPKVTEGKSAWYTFRGKLHSKIIISDLIIFFWWWRSEVEIRTGRWSNRQRKKWHVRAFVTPVVPPHLHARSREPIEMIMISRNQFVGDLPQWTYYVWLDSRPFRSLKFLTPGTSDVMPAASSSPEIFWPFSVVCLTAFLFEFWPRTFTIELYRKKPTKCEFMIWSVVSIWKKPVHVQCAITVFSDHCQRVSQNRSPSPGID